MNLLVWDFDGTLAYREGLWSGTLESIVKRHCPDSTLSQADFRPFLAQGYRWHAPEQLHRVCSADEWWAELEPIFTRAFSQVGATPAQAAAWANEVRAEYMNPERWQVYPDTISTLEKLTRDGWTHAILTNHVPEFRELLTALNLTPHFTFIVNSAETGAEKPHPEAFASVLEQTGQLERICMIGDSPRADIRGAQKAGWPAMLVRNKAENYDWQTETLSDVPEVLARIFQ